MSNKQIPEEELIEDFKSGANHFLYKYANTDLSEQENLLHIAVKYAPFSVIKHLVEEKQVPLFHSIGNDDEIALTNIKNRSLLHNDSAEVYSLLVTKMNEKNPTWATTDSPTYSSIDTVIDDPRITTNQKKDIIASLIQAGADLNKSHNKGHPSTVLGRALWRKDDELAKFLIDAGANPNLLEPTIGKTSLAFDSTGATTTYVEQMKKPIEIDKDWAIRGLLKFVEDNNISEMKRHLERPEFRNLSLNGKNVYEMAKENIPGMTDEMNDLLKYNVAPKINKNVDESPINRMLAIREKALGSTKNENQYKPH